ncbi:MAG: hypothetical protein MRZ29_09000 [Oscillospiraceae bacterium]|nr:hypothetical protein [Oscillospiraceae bacterium]
MKGLCKRIISWFSVAAMIVATLGTVGVSAANEAPTPNVSSWVESGTNYPRTAEMSISYGSGAAYSGKYSLTALYDENGALVGMGCGRLDANGASDYAVNIAAEGAASVKCFIWEDLSTVKSAVPVYKTTYENFTNNIAFYVPAGGLGIRNSFESGLFQIFQNPKASAYTAEIVEDGKAHTGTKYAKVSNRKPEEKATLRIKLPSAETSKTPTIKVKAFMKKPDYVKENAEFYINILTPRTVGGTLTNKSTSVIVSDNEWHEVSYSLDLSTIENIKGDYAVELGARTGSEGSYTYIDYYADDFTIICPNADISSVFDDTKTDKLKWDFEDATNETAITKDRELNRLKHTNKWTRVLGAQTLSIESVSDGKVTASTEGSTKMLSVAADTSDDNLNAHVTARIKLSKLDIVPGKTYEISFRAFGDKMPRALYIGLLNHQDATIPSAFTGSKDTTYNKYAGGIIDYKGANYTKNRVAVMTTSWQKYTYTITPKAENFDDDGFADLYFVMTGDKTIAGSKWNSTDMLMGEKLYLDEIEITEKAASDVPVLEKYGSYTKRATFESDNMDMFSPQARASVVLTDADANTGSYCAEFSNRVNNWTSLGSSIKGADLTSSVTASCYLKKNSLKL